jgi:hypothetical protein
MEDEPLHDMVDVRRVDSLRDGLDCSTAKLKLKALPVDGTGEVPDRQFGAKPLRNA